MTRLNLGCGERKAEGFINVDYRYVIRPDMVADVRWLPFRDETVDYVSASQVIEHISHREVDATLEHWVGLLKNGGQLFISCPDIEEIARDFGSMEFDTWIRLIFGDQDYLGNYHFTGFTEQVVKEKLVGLGMRIKDSFTANGGINCWSYKSP